MSYILEALRKSEQARSGKATLTGAAAAPAAPVRSARRGLRAGGLLLLLLVAWGGWWLGRSAVPAARPGPATAPAPEPRPAPAPAAAVAEDAGADRPVAAAPVVPPRLRPLPPVAAPPPDRVVTAPATPAPAQQAGAPAWPELPAEQRSRVTRPHIDVHVYAEDPARRFVLIDLRRYREGDRLPSGARLERIEADGILLEEDGIRYRVPRP